MLCPFNFPILTPFLNRFLAKIPFFQHFCLACYIIARPHKHRVPEINHPYEDASVSVVIPTRNEKGNIENIFTRVPQMGRWTELIFVDGNSTDGTVETILECQHEHEHQWKHVELLQQTGKGKGQAMRQAFDICRGDIFMILDSDLTMPPEDLPKYYHALLDRKGECINGCRLIYPMEKQAMRFLNMVANKLFASLFTWLLGQPIKDTLCGTKVIRAADYRKIAANRSHFGDFDPFGDFDLLFGAARLNLKIIDMPIRYKDRTYGEIKIQRWKHGWLLLKMCYVAFKKLKLG
jgi:glycosyltransferase involved in cell wall biosynthesis